MKLVQATLSVQKAVFNTVEVMRNMWRPVLVLGKLDKAF